MSPRDAHWLAGYRRVVPLLLAARPLVTETQKQELLSLMRRELPAPPQTWHDGGKYDAVLDAFN